MAKGMEVGSARQVLLLPLFLFWQVGNTWINPVG